MKNYSVKITGAMPMLMHADSIDWADKMESWQKTPANKSKSKAGDDRWPRWRWVGCLYNDGAVVTIPTENIQSCVMAASKQVPTGKGTQTFKEISQSGILFDQLHTPLMINGKTLDIKAVQAALSLEESFSEQQELAQSLGFLLFMKRAKIGNSKHVRVRPRFDNWAVSTTITVTEDRLTLEILTQIFTVAGRLKGLGDWRPSAPKSPGPWGTFTAEITKV